MNDPDDFSSTFQTSRKDHSKIGLPFRVPVLGWFLCAALHRSQHEYPDEPEGEDRGYLRWCRRCRRWRW